MYDNNPDIEKGFCPIQVSRVTNTQTYSILGTKT